MINTPFVHDTTRHCAFLITFRYVVATLFSLWFSFANLLFTHSSCRYYSLLFISKKIRTTRGNVTQLTKIYPVFNSPVKKKNEGNESHTQFNEGRSAIPQTTTMLFYFFIFSYSYFIFIIHFLLRSVCLYILFTSIRTLHASSQLELWSYLPDSFSFSFNLYIILHKDFAHIQLELFIDIRSLF